MSTTIAGAAHYDRPSGRLYINGAAVCSGCGRESANRYCNPVCEVKHAAEARHLRTRQPARTLNQINVRATAKPGGAS